MILANSQHYTRAKSLSKKLHIFDDKRIQNIKQLRVLGVIFSYIYNKKKYNKTLLVKSNLAGKILFIFAQSTCAKQNRLWLIYIE